MTTAKKDKVDSLAPLRERNFRFYYASRVVNMLGNAMASVALAFAVLDITDDDPGALGFVLAAHSVPMVVLLLWGGVIADRFPRNLVIQFSNIASAITQGLIAALVITGVANLWSLVTLSFVHGIVSAVSFPAMASIMPQLVPRGELQRANALMSLARSALTILGPTVSALLVVFVGSGYALAVDAATWAVSAVLLGFVTLPTKERAT
ncbi:MAG: enterobactin exporter EntS, partial [Nocardioides sp.]|nr:enterobactin exporter EntS [Nocardioides sp.]